MAGHNTNEGVLFASPFVRNDQNYANLVSSLFPGISPAALCVLTDNLYPANFSGEYGYVDQTGRVASTIGESLVSSTNIFSGRHSNAAMPASGMNSVYPRLSTQWIFRIPFTILARRYLA